MFVIHTSVPNHAVHIYEPTRLIIGCPDQVHAITAMLQSVGLDVGEVEQTEQLPVRTQEELDRAQRLMFLLFNPTVGSA